MAIVCQLCGRAFRFLPTHLRKAHGISTTEYRRDYQIQAGEPLADEHYRAAHRAKMDRMVRSGKLTRDHLPDATEAARTAGRGVRTDADLAAQRERILASRPWEANQLPPGAKRADGRDADRARETQRTRRERNSAPKA